jgi:membrane associated rhomboid family serine protease
MNQYQFSAPPLSKLNKIIIITAGASFLLSSILKAIGAFSLVKIFGLSAAGTMSGLVYQLVTYPFIEVHLMSFVFSSLILWFIGSELESTWGRKVYSRFLLLNVLGVGLFYLLISTLFFYGTHVYSSSLHGLSGINFAMLMAYAILYPNRQMSLMMIFPMKARTFCLILAGIEAYMAIFSSLTTAWAHLLAMGFSYLIIRFQDRLLIKKALHFTFDNKKRSKKHLYVVKDDEQKPPKFWH